MTGKTVFSGLGLPFIRRAPVLSVLALSVLGFSMLCWAPKATEAAEDSKRTLPSASVMVVDIQATMQQSLAAKAIRAERDRLLHALQGDLETSRKTLKEMETQLTEERTTPPSEDWQQRARSFERQVSDFNHRFQRNNQAVDKSFRSGMTEVSQALTRVVEEVAGEMGANLVLPKSQIFLHAPGMEVTDIILARLNQQYPTVDFPPPILEAQPKMFVPSGTSFPEKKN